MKVPTKLSRKLTPPQQARLLNVLYANLAVCLMLDSFLILGQYLELKTLDHTLLSCVLFKSHIFLSLFLLGLFFQISVVTSIKHYNPGLYLELSLHWRRLPVLAFQLMVVALFFIAIEYLAGFEADMKRIVFGSE